MTEAEFRAKMKGTMSIIKVAMAINCVSFVIAACFVVWLVRNA